MAASEIDLIGPRVLRFAQGLADAGASREQINAALKPLIPLVNERLRLERALARNERQIRALAQIFEPH